MLQMIANGSENETEHDIVESVLSGIARLEFEDDLGWGDEILSGYESSGKFVDSEENFIFYDFDKRVLRFQVHKDNTIDFNEFLNVFLRTWALNFGSRVRGLMSIERNKKTYHGDSLSNSFQGQEIKITITGNEKEALEKSMLEAISRYGFEQELVAVYE